MKLTHIYTRDPPYTKHPHHSDMQTIRSHSLFRQNQIHGLNETFPINQVALIHSRPLLSSLSRPRSTNPPNASTPWLTKCTHIQNRHTSSTQKHSDRIYQYSIGKYNFCFLFFSPHREYCCFVCSPMLHKITIHA